MAQIALSFDSQPAALPLAGTAGSTGTATTPEAGPAQQDPVAFEIGRDHAHYGLVPPTAHLHPAHPVRQGWEHGQQRRRQRGQRPLAASAPVQAWLALRLQAWLAGEHFETMQLTPHYLAQLARSHCPVTGEAGTADRPLQLCRINRQAGYAAGNLAALGARAAAALSDDDAVGSAESDQAGRAASAPANCSACACCNPSSRR